MHILNNDLEHTIQARSVAGLESVTAGAAIVVLDPDPNHLAYPTPDEVVSTIDEEDLAGAAAEQSGAAELLTPIPVVGPIVANLIGTKLAERCGRTNRSSHQRIADDKCSGLDWGIGSRGDRSSGC
jgi:hypothetical protein